MKIVGYILVVGTIIGAIIMFVLGIRSRQYILIPASIVGLVFGLATSYAVVYAADVPKLEGVAQSASAKADSRAMTVAKDLDALRLEVHKLRVEVTTLKNQLKEKNEEN